MFNLNFCYRDATKVRIISLYIQFREGVLDENRRRCGKDAVLGNQRGVPTLNLLNKDIYIGLTHVITPRYFVDDLKVLELGGVGSQAIPNGLAESRGQRPYQEYYDDE
ncbi:hypothetical protein J3R30DRAFT_3684648 [Lentinula aciculospora]|uniref:Uncharacterized protein n=1 Tax=Lentinula aciculospora TaxID=153920 RepID=A0A9W9A4A5_9AGAR|nr:hypothetical protein J3R30DRAFT_3684648 [Lentinula aciculospora]